MTTTRQMCSLFARDQGEDPTGTAGRWDLYVLMELPLPWARDAWDSPRIPDGLQELAARAKMQGLRLRALAIQPDPEYSEPGCTRVFIYRRPEEPFAHYAKAEYIVPNEEITSFLSGLLSDEDHAEGSPGPNPYARDTGDIREMFVCTHGTRDACCGKFGYSVYSLLRHVHAPAMEGKMRAWRVSHLGGHRFAPNLLDFPEARYWAFLDTAVVEAVLFRESPVEGLGRHYRGWSALEPLAQVAEREILLREGWAWMLYLKSAQILEGNAEGTSATIRMEYSEAESLRHGAYEATVEQSGIVLMNTCLKLEPPREVPQYAVTRLEKVAPAEPKP
jgi:hypothetical protein